MSVKLPPIKYKIHPKIQQIIEEKQRRKQILQKQKDKRQKEQQATRKERKLYFEANKNVIEEKKQAIFTKKLSQHHKIKQQQKQRQIRIETKKLQRLQKLIPQRFQMIQQMKQSYIEYLQEKDQIKQMKIKEIMDQRLEQANQQFKKIKPIEVRIQQENLIDINESQCILCLSEKAQIYMVECRHLISCPDCEFMLRMQKKCPVCRKYGNYKNLNQKMSKRKFSVKK